ncbi:hypothetical protein [Flexivirga caeni]|uniref:hypothetical protein n=1 Tax=Flexivirga caeni TaxID=2294115 RepID=UPI0011CDA81B|nr:hypothetical protein [Flexivirga caeni]
MITCALTAGAAALRVARAGTRMSYVGAGAPVVVINVPGLSWSGRGLSAYPVLRDHLPKAAVGTLFRFASSTEFCAASAWSTISAGSVHGPTSGTTTGPRNCATGVRRDATGLPESLARTEGYPGALAHAAEQHGQCVSAAGEYAALGAADSSGRVDDFRADPADFATTCHLTLIDLPPGSARRLLPMVLRRVPAGPDVIVAGLSTVPGRPANGLGAIVCWGPGVRPGELTSHQTRHPGLVAVDDIAATLYRSVGQTQLAGYARPLLSATATPPFSAARAARRRTAALAVSSSLAAPYLTCAFAGLAVLLIVLVVLLRTARRVRRRRIWALVVAVSSTLAALPAACLLVNTVGWESAGRPRLALAVGVSLIACLIGAAATATRSYRLGPLFTVCVLTWWAMIVDTILGTPWQLLSMMGLLPEFASRYFGMGNLGYGTFVTVTLLTLSVVGSAARQVWSSRATMTVVVLLGLLSAAVDNGPGLGNDGGGGLALVPAVALVLWNMSAKCHRGRWIAGTVVITCLWSLACAGLDSLYPPEYRTHLGFYFDRLVHHDDISEFTHAISINTTFVQSRWWISLIPALLLLSIALALVPKSALPAWTFTAWRFDPIVSAALTTVLFAWTLGFLVNDSGVSIPAAGMLTAFPLLLAFGAWERPAGDIPPGSVDSTGVVGVVGGA